MVILDTTEMKVLNTSDFALNVTTGDLVVTMQTDDHSSSDFAITESSKLTVPESSVLTFSLNGDTATITRL